MSAVLRWTGPATAAPPPTPGIVVLVGAGPGDPELLTLKGLAWLRRAEVLVYDRLVHPALLDWAPPEALRIDAGKRPGHHLLRQEETSALLVSHARAGRVVVRLKGGDPFVFGRGGEEALACSAAGVPWAVVPGVSSAVAVPAWAGIPVTHRGLASSFAVVTATGSAGAGRPPWAALAAVDTLVVLMGVATLAEVTAELLAAGRDPDTPVALVERATLPDGRTLVATLATVAPCAAAWGARSPATLVVGPVVELAGELAAAGEPLDPVLRRALEPC
jgi:uroporphyrinogen III methyltransferase/synthase